MNHTLLFFRKFLRHGLKIASIVPSSKYLAEAALAGIDWQKARVILELGAGTGPITAAILSHANPDCRIIAIERDPDFISVLKRRFKGHRNLEIVRANIADLLHVLAELNVGSVDYVVSGLPVPSFAKELQIKLFRDLRVVLSSYGSFNQITEIPLLYERFYKKFFHSVRFKLEPRNIPPGGVYICRDFREF